MRTLRRIIAEAIKACLDSSTGSAPGTTQVEVWEYLQATGSADLAAHTEEMIRKGVYSIIRDLLRDTALDDGVKTREHTQLPLPGFKPPTTLAVQQPNGDYRYIPYLKVTLKDYDQALLTRRNGIWNDIQSVQDLEQKRDVLYPYLSRDDTMTVGDAIQLLMKDKQAAA